MRYLIAAMLLLMPFSPAHAAVGDAALEAAFNGLAPELAGRACEDGNQNACADVSKDVASQTAELIKVIHRGQAACAADRRSDGCALLKVMDREAEQVLAEHGRYRT